MGQYLAPFDFNIMRNSMPTSSGSKCRQAIGAIARTEEQQEHTIQIEKKRHFVHSEGGRSDSSSASERVHQLLPKGSFVWLMQHLSGLFFSFLRIRKGAPSVKQTNLYEEASRRAYQIPCGRDYGVGVQPAATHAVTQTPSAELQAVTAAGAPAPAVTVPKTYPAPA